MPGGVRITLVDGEAPQRQRVARRPSGHGTAVAATISDDLPPGSRRLLSVRVFSRRPEAPAAPSPPDSAGPRSVAPNWRN